MVTNPSRFRRISPRLEADELLISEFEEHARSEIDCWDPEPPGINGLQEFAEHLKLEDLAADLQVIVDKASMRDMELEQTAVDSPSSPSYIEEQSNSDFQGKIDEMFRRLR